MTWILAFVFILGAAVILHEFGHFIVAKLLRIRVETFSVGFGKRVWGRRWGTTDYRLSLIPLGGYVKLGGDDSNAGLEEGNEEEEIPERERFDLRPRWQKFCVGVAGPVMNVITALAVPFALAMIVGVAVMPPPVVKTVAEGSAAERAGVKPGDRIVSFNGDENSDWERIQNDALLSPDQPLPLEVERDGRRLPLTITPTRQVEGGEAIGRLGILPDYGDVPVIVGYVEPGTPAAEAGMKLGERVVSIGGERVTSGEQVRQYIRSHTNEPITLVLSSGGEAREVVAQTRKLGDGSERLGFQPLEDPPTRRIGAGAAARHAVARNIEMLRLTGKALGQVFSGQRSVRDTFAGPIGIAQASKRAAEEGGLEGVFVMLGFLSLNLGIFNLLPIPVLDGGMIFMLFLEGALGLVGKKLSMQARERIQQVGFVFLLLLMGFVIINDVTKYAPGWFRSGDRPAETQQK